MDEDIEMLTQRASELFDNHLIIGELSGEDSDEVKVSTTMNPLELLFHLQALQHCILNDKLEQKTSHLSVVH